MALCQKVCELCLKRHGITLDRRDWTKSLRVTCPECALDEDDAGGSIRVYDNPPERCPFLVEHVVSTSTTRR